MYYCVYTCTGEYYILYVCRCVACACACVCVCVYSLLSVCTTSVRWSSDGICYSTSLLLPSSVCVGAGVF